MEKHIEYKTKGTCSRAVIVDVEDGYIKECAFVGGCAGNTKGVAALVKGMKVEDAIAKIKGIKLILKHNDYDKVLPLALTSSRWRLKKQ